MRMEIEELVSIKVIKRIISIYIHTGIYVYIYIYIYIYIYRKKDQERFCNCNLDYLIKWLTYTFECVDLKKENYEHETLMRKDKVWETIWVKEVI